jgi:hypothetical protein
MTTTHLHLNKKVVACRTLKEIEQLEAFPQFIRVHHSYMVNLNEVDKYIREKFLVMSDGSTVVLAEAVKPCSNTLTCFSDESGTIWLSARFSIIRQHFG